MKDKKALTLKTLNKSNVWELQENDIFRLWEAGEKDADLKDNIRHYTDIIKSAFEMEEVKVDKPEVIKKYEARDFKIGVLRIDDSNKIKFAVKKKAILRVTDLTYENIRHISAAKLLEVIDRNFAGILYLKAYKTLSRLVSISAPLPFLKIDFTSQVDYMRKR